MIVRLGLYTPCRQILAPAVRMLFDWLFAGQVVPFNSAFALRGTQHVVKTGKTPVLDPAEWAS